MTSTCRPSAGNDGERVELERLSADDRATRRSAELVDEALAAHRARNERLGQLQNPGICTNCGELCLPAAVFCDVDCREDFEHRERVQGFARAR